MWNGNSNYKKFAYTIIFFVILIIFCYKPYLQICFAENADKSDVEQELSNTIDEILDDIDSSGLDEFVISDFDYFNSGSFIEIVKNVLSGNLFSDYDSLAGAIFELAKEGIKNLLLFIFTIFSLVVLFELFNNFCVSKYIDLKNIVKIIFSILITLLIMGYLKNIFDIAASTINTIFNFSKIEFPILLSLILLSGSTGTHSVYNALSVFVLNTGSYIFIYILLPIALAIIVFSAISPIFSKNKFSKIISTLKSVFRYIIIIYLSVFAIFSSINAVSSGVLDGVNYKITKFAIKSYVPILGGYLSDGFDFVHSCSVIIKNSFGICGILVLFFIILNPIIKCIVFSFSLKIISVLVSFVGNNTYADYFETVSTAVSYLITIIVGVFMCLFVFIYLLILSVSVI